MKSKCLPFVLLLLIILFSTGISVDVYADTSYTVTFYSDADMKKVYDTQEVKQGEHPKTPKDPKGYEADEYRYEFDKWYWNVDGAAMEYSFDGEDYEIWSDTDIFAGYTQYLKDGYELVVKSADGTDFITDSETPVTQLLNEYYGVEQVYAQKEGEYTTDSDKVASEDLHSRTIKVLVLISAILAIAVIAVVIKIRKKRSESAE